LCYSPTLNPLTTVSYTVDEVKWVLRDTSSYLDDVKYATSINHTTDGAGSAKTVFLSSTQYLGNTLATSVNVDDRILVKSQTDHTENGVYKVTTKYSSGQNSFSDPRNSTSTLDSYWTSSTGITSRIKAGEAFDIAVLRGDTYGGRNYRVYSSLTNPDYTDLNWSETTYHNTYINAIGYLEITEDSSITVGLATTTSLPNTPDWSASSNSFTATGAATTLVIDGVNVTSSNTKILVKNQGSGYGASNGIYALSTIGGTATTWVLTRTSDFNQSYETIDLSPVLVSSGNVNAGSKFYLNTQGPITLNTTELTWETRGFEYVSGGGATIYGLPLTISATGGTTYTLQTGDTLLIKDLTTRVVNSALVSNSHINGIYTVDAIGSTAVVIRTTGYDESSLIEPLAIKTDLNENINGGQHFYMNKADQTAQNFTLNVSGIAISDSNIKYRYTPCTNIVFSNITSQYGLELISEKTTAKGVISLDDRILVTNQTDAYKNGIWRATGYETLTKLGFSDTYTIQNGGLIYVVDGIIGSATTYMLYSAASNGTTPGSNTVKFFDYNAAFTGSGETTAVAITTIDKLSTNYVSPDDFKTSAGGNTAVNGGDRVVVNINSSNNNKNGIYTAGLGNTLNYAWNFHPSFSEWWNNVSKTDSNGIETNFIGQDRSLYYVNNFETATKGNIYIPRVRTAKKTSVSFDDKQLENYNLDWLEQEYQKYYVRAAFACTAVPPSTAATGSSLYKVFSSSGSSSLIDGDVVLVICNELYPTNTSSDFGSTKNFASPNNGIYKARISSAVGYTGRVYFEKHSDWYYSSTFSGSKKILASPYERPTIVRATEGFISGYGQSIALTKSVFYMQGALKTRVSGTYTTGDEGSENFISGSNVYVSYDYDNLHTFPKIAPIQHYLNYDILNPITKKINYNINTENLTLNASSQILTYVSGTGYTVKKGDRILFDFRNSAFGWFGSINPYAVSGVYTCVEYNGINSSTSGAPSYSFNKIGYSRGPGHIDFYKELTNNGTGSSTGSTVTFNLQTTKDSNFTWHPSTYRDKEIFYSNDGTNFLAFSGTSSLGATSGTLKVSVGNGITTGSSIKVRLTPSEIANYPDIDPVNNLYNYNFIAEQILVDRANVATTAARNNTNLNSYDVEEMYWENIDETYDSGYLLKAYNKYTAPGTAGTTVTGKTTVDYIINSEKLYPGSGTGNTFFFARRLYSDSSYGGGATTGGTFYPHNYFTSSNDFYVGGWSLESNTTTPWYQTYCPIGSTSLISAVEVAFAGGGGTEKTILLIQKINIGNLNASQQSLYYKGTTPTYRAKYGKNDQYVLQFKGPNKKSITLTYDNDSFPSILEPKRVRVGSGSTYFLNYDPNLTSRSNANRVWIKDSSITNYGSALVTTTENINLDEDISILNSTSINVGDIVLVKDQTDNTKNGIYINSNVNYWYLNRPSDFNNSNDMKPFGLVNVSGFGDYELNLPEEKPYAIWNIGDAPGDDIIFKYYSEGPSVFAKAATVDNYNLYSTSIPDIIDGYTPNDQDKILLLGQTSGTAEKVLARYNKTFQASLSRVATGSTAGEFEIRSLRVKQYSGTGSSTAYETYFDPDATTVGVGSINFIPVTSIFNYPQADYVSNTNIDLTVDLNSQLASFDPTPTSFSTNKTILLKDQTYLRENLLYTTASTSIMLLKRDSSLDTSEKISNNLRVNVTSFDEGLARSGTYGIWYTGTPGLDSDPLYFLKQYEGIKLLDCDCATTSDVSIGEAPTEVDGYVLKTNDRILVKNQNNPSENGIYYVFNQQNYLWKRASDLKSSYQVVPHLNAYIKNGLVNGDKVFVINLTNTPRTITDTNLYPYIIDTDPIAWTDFNFSTLFNTNPVNWKDLPDNRAGAASLQSAKINEFGYAESSNIALAIYVPTVTGKLADSNGQVRNQKINVEYDIAKD
jgi:hypothetical protein